MRHIYLLPISQERYRKLSRIGKRVGMQPLDVAVLLIDYGIGLNTIQAPSLGYRKEVRTVKK